MLLKIQFYARGVSKLCFIMLMLFSLIMLHYAHNNLNYARNHMNYADFFQQKQLYSRLSLKKLYNYFSI